MEIVSGLNSIPVSRLRATWAVIIYHLFYFILDSKSKSIQTIIFFF